MTTIPPAVPLITPPRKRNLTDDVTPPPIVSDLKRMLKSRLNLWKTKGRHATLPENILVYRDGVSEGQYHLVLQHEFPLLRAACAESKQPIPLVIPPPSEAVPEVKATQRGIFKPRDLPKQVPHHISLERKIRHRPRENKTANTRHPPAVYPPAMQKQGLPRMTVVVVGKRHHTRFYPTSAQNADRSANCTAGTVVDRGVTEARNWDFFLQAVSNFWELLLPFAIIPSA